MKNLSILFLSATLIFGASLSADAQKVAYTVTNTFKIKSSGGWDYIAVGPDNNRLYVSHATQVNILDQTTGDSIGVIEGTTGVHGIAFNKKMNKGFTSNGKLNNSTVFDLTTNQVLGTLTTGTNPDAIMFESFTNTLVTCNGKSSDLTFIDVDKNTITATVPVGGKPETAVSDDAGLVYVNVEDKNEIAVIDTKTFKVINHFSLLPGESPTGLVLDKATNRLFATCEKLLVVVNAATGKITNKLEIGEGTDGVAFDATTKTIYTSNGASGTVSVIHQKSANDYTMVGNFASKKGAKTIALDEKKHLVYMPTCEYGELMPATEPGKKPRAKMIPGTFQVLVMGQTEPGK